MTGGPVERAAAMLREARRILVLTGAGISAESGVPTFRGPQGLWKTHRPEELATPEAFARDPRLVWEWYAWRRERVAACRPNAAHLALARLAAGRDGVTIVTQNVDGLHAEAALALGERADAATPIELHGSLFRSRCTSCGRRAENRGPIDASSEATLPLCSDCGGLLRPDVVWFGEALDHAAMRAAFTAAAAADACLVVGTSALVYPAAGIPIVAREHGAGIVEVNPEPTALTPLAAVTLRLPATDGVPAILGHRERP